MRVGRTRTGPVGTGLAGTGLAGTGPVGTGPAGTGPLGTGPLGTGPLGTGPGEATLTVTAGRNRVATGPVAVAGPVPPTRTRGPGGRRRSSRPCPRSPRPRWWTAVGLPRPTIGPSAARGSIDRGRRAPAETAFTVRTLVASVHSLAQVWRAGTRPDVAAIVVRIARGEPLSEVPMARHRGHPNRICVLWDSGLKAGPYRADLQYLVRTIRRLFGDSRLAFLAFRGSPARGCGAGPVWTWQLYADHPRSDVTMIVGSGAVTRRHDPEALHDFAMTLVSAGREVCAVLIGADPSTPPFRPYPQLLVRD